MTDSEREALERAASRYRDAVVVSDAEREALYDAIRASTLSVRDIARATGLSYGRVNQIQHGK